MFILKKNEMMLIAVLMILPVTIPLKVSFVYADMKRAPTIEETNDNISGWFWQLIDQINKMWKIDMLPYWMPLNQDNTKTFKYPTFNHEVQQRRFVKHRKE